MKTINNITNLLYIFFLEDVIKVLYANVRFNNEYHLKDHLGNTSAVFADDDGSGSISTNEISLVSDYYSFGLKHIESYYPNDADQKYLYNGKELQEDTEWYDYGTRMYDPATGRWMCLDPQANKYYSISPYVYVASEKHKKLTYMHPEIRVRHKEMN